MAPSGKLPFYVIADDYPEKFEAMRLITDSRNFHFRLMPHIACTASVTIGIGGGNRYWRRSGELAFYVIVDDYSNIVLPPLRL